jgi:hypothetical protein
MDTPGPRALISQLADDLAWLEFHCRQRESSPTGATVAYAVQASMLRLAAAVVRNCLGPALDGQPAEPLHIVVVGGAGAGKSTVANLLSGAAAAEANPQAGFTRHPIAYTNPSAALNWTGHLGFLGPLQRATEPGPSSIDADIYQVRRVVPPVGSLDLLQKFVVWDCPDMTTWAASSGPTPGARGSATASGSGYLYRLFEVGGLADVIVYVASDERYNDEVPTQFLHLLLQTGKPVVCCLMKMREADADAIVRHFQQEVVRHLPPGIVATIAIPYLPPEQLADPARLASRYRVPLLNQIAVLGEPADGSRRRTVHGAVAFLKEKHEQLTAVARHDVAALAHWRTVVQNGQVEFDQRYSREYLTSEKYRGFDEALIKLLGLLELPGVGKIISGTLYVIRTPFRLVSGLFSKALRRPETPSMPEYPVLEQSLRAWIDGMRSEAARLGGTHPLWSHIAQGFAERGLAEQVEERFQQGFRAFQMGVASETDRTARAIYEQLEKNPGMLNTLRGGKFAIDAGAILAAFATGGVGLHDIILVPLAAWISNLLVELLGKQYVDNQRELARQRQQMLMAQYISGPMAEWLTQWPATGGSSFERLQLALRRIPQAIDELAVAVQAG